MDVFSASQFRDDEAARKFLEATLWPDGPVCPHCGVANHAYATKRPGVFRCAEKVCRKDFTVTMKTVMERSHIALHKWVQAFALMTASKKGISAHQLHRTLDIHYQSAWFMAHRIRECMRARWPWAAWWRRQSGGSRRNLFRRYSRKSERRAAQDDWSSVFANEAAARSNKRAIIALVERGGEVRSFQVPECACWRRLSHIVRKNIARESAPAHGRKQSL